MKRISARGIIIEDSHVYLMFRRRIDEEGNIKEYYVIPGGGIEEDEELEKGLVREMLEEFSVEVKIEKYVGFDESENSIAHFYRCSIIDGTPKLGGEELEKNCEKNYYEIKKIAISDLDKVDVMGKEIIILANKN